MTRSSQRTVVRLQVVLTLLSVLFTIGLAAPTFAKDKKKKKRGQGDLYGEVAGVVVDRDGNQLKGIEVELTAKADGSAAGSAVTNKKGQFELSVLLAEASAGDAEETVAASYQIDLRGEGYAPFSNELSVAAGQRIDVEITLLDAAAGLRSRAIGVFNEGVQFHGAGNMDQAAERFREALEIDPSVAEPYLGLADIALAAGKPEEGLASIEVYLERKPDDPAGQRMAYEIYRALGRMDEARALAGKLGLEGVEKDLAILVFNEGAIASRKNDDETALAKFHQAVEMDPDLGPAWAGIASIYYNQRQLEEAVEPAARSVELQPDHEPSARIHFLVLDGLGRPEAADAWDAFRKLNQPAALELLYLRADLDFRNNATDSAQAAARQILTIDADHAGAHLLLGKILSSTDTATAKAHLRKFLELAPPDDADRPLAEEMVGYLE
ncbi:MAG: tetratricopeptide repeat protein [Thermoanaerobaculia bacterium]|nr:tetratricopeptide repeat protein [Thermoanaerobaculia bacterium]